MLGGFFKSVDIKSGVQPWRDFGIMMVRILDIAAGLFAVSFNGSFFQGKSVGVPYLTLTPLLIFGDGVDQ